MQRNEFDSGDQIGIDIVRILWFGAARNAHAKFAVRRDVSKFFKRRRLSSMNRPRRNQQQTQ